MLASPEDSDFGDDEARQDMVDKSPLLNVPLVFVLAVDLIGKTTS